MNAEILRDFRKVTGLSEKFIIQQLNKRVCNPKDILNFYIKYNRFTSYHEDEFSKLVGMDIMFFFLDSGIHLQH